SVTRALAFMIGGYWVITGKWQLGSLIAFATYLGMVVGPAQSLLGLYVAVQRMAVSLQRVTELRDEQPDIVTAAKPAPTPRARARRLLGLYVAGHRLAASLQRGTERRDKQP